MEEPLHKNGGVTPNMEPCGGTTGTAAVRKHLESMMQKNKGAEVRGPLTDKLETHSDESYFKVSGSQAETEG
jgi:hypothetical protein